MTPSVIGFEIVSLFSIGKNPLHANSIFLIGNYWYSIAQGVCKDIKKNMSRK